MKPSTPKTFSENLKKFLTPEGIIVLCPVLLLGSTILYCACKSFWMGVARLFGLH